MDIRQASDCALLDKISPFFGVSGHELCGFHKNALVAKVFMKHVDFVNFNFRRFLSPE